MSKDTTPSTPTPGKGKFPVLPLRDIVVFPYMIVPLFVGREKSIAALEEVMQIGGRERMTCITVAIKFNGT